jgi:hypothetical protein
LQASKQRILAELDRLGEESKAKQVAAAQETGRKLSEAELQAQAIILQNRSAFQKRLDELSLTARQAQIQALLVTANDEQRLRLQTELLELEHQRRLEAIRQEFGNKRGIGESQVNALIEQERARHLAQLEVLNNQFAQKELEQKQKREQMLLSAEVAFNQGLLQITYAFVESLGAALVDGGNAWSSFEAFALNTFGSMLVNLGMAAIGIGALIEGIKVAVLSLSGPFAIVAGVALIALGGALKALAGQRLRKALGGRGGGSFATPPPVYGGTPIGSTGPVSGGPVTGNTDFASREQQRLNQAGVTINIQGSIFDSEATGSRIVSLVNDAFKRQGVRVAGAT